MWHHVQAGTHETAKADLEVQLEHWERKTTLVHIDPERRRLYRVLAGHVHGVRAQEMPWERCVGLQVSVLACHVAVVALGHHCVFGLA